MERKILLEKSRHRNAVNVSNVVGVDLYNKTNILNGDNISGNFSYSLLIRFVQTCCSMFRRRLFRTKVQVTLLSLVIPLLRMSTS